MDLNSNWMPASRVVAIWIKVNIRTQRRTPNRYLTTSARSNISFHFSFMSTVNSGLWIYCTDLLLSAFVTLASTLNIYQTYKGICFVLTTPTLFYFLARMQFALLEKVKESQVPNGKCILEIGVVNTFSDTRQINITMKKRKERIRISLSAAHRVCRDMAAFICGAIVSCVHVDKLQYEPDACLTLNICRMDQL